MFRGTPCTIKRIRVQILYVEPIAGVLYRIDLGNHWTSEHQVNPVHPKTATTFRHVNLPWKISHKFLKGPGLIYGLLYLRYLHVQWKCCKYYLIKYFLILLNTNKHFPKFFYKFHLKYNNLVSLVFMMFQKYVVNIHHILYWKRVGKKQIPTNKLKI